MLRVLTHTFTLTGAGETKESAFNQIFAQVKSKVAQEIEGLAIRIEPERMDIVHAKKTIHTERFLGFLFPRKRNRYEITVNLTVQLRVIDVAKIDFDTEEEQLTRVQHLIRME
ncbi:DUF4312 family protein [Laceyella putida]|uniref:DUF4312 family protein n=1 Tax=Laceyella putida TaxID=110101 RepID=A0ABW2RP41_9BACL